MRKFFPYRSLPTGWFQVGWSHLLGSGDVVPLRYFGRDLVLYRGESGTPVVLDAFCAHLGAHLGYGGKVSADDIVCPFHGWRWSSEGRNVEIPYSAKVNRSRRVQPWPVHEASGMIYVWHDAAGRAPSWRPPATPEHDNPDYYQPVPDAIYRWENQPLHPQFVLENLVDLAHLKYIHRWEEIPVSDRAEGDGHVFRSEFHGKIPTRKGTQEVRIKGEAHGIGLIFSRLIGVRDTLQSLAVTPVDDDRADLLISVWVRRLAGEDPTEPPPVVRSIVHAQTVREYEHDAPIWRNQIYLAHPPWPPEEAPGHVAIRRWAAGFYPDGAEAKDSNPERTLFAPPSGRTEGDAGAV